MLGDLVIEVVFQLRLMDCYGCLVARSTVVPGTDGPVGVGAGRCVGRGAEARGEAALRASGGTLAAGARPDGYGVLAVGGGIARRVAPAPPGGSPVVPGAGPPRGGAPPGALLGGGGAVAGGGARGVAAGPPSRPWAVHWELLRTGGVVAAGAAGTGSAGGACCPAAASPARGLPAAKSPR